MTANRSSRPDVRNPVMALPAARELAALLAAYPSHRARYRSLHQQIAKEARARAEKSWRTHKAPMALYWKQTAVYARHIAQVLK